ncbi:transglycosylase SLT domain-containing protein [Cupriavidus pauculus]|uniref:transglycosylase SLT domain-containing protein n=1 Tax=Cupriavidus pauculus TaxID=82633 RepID=UPI001EE1FCA1|nr:transporter substrate-binding domain-containing protein [Cupriavidus pauculus]GJG94250.1 transporter substrate-binding domain-containing protein [Cupriavidus pauculus]
MEAARAWLRPVLSGVALWVASAFSVAAPPNPSPPPTPAAKTAPASAARQLDLTNKPWRGDFDAMVDRRVIRVLVPYSRTLYFNDRGHERGLTSDFVRDFERFINKTYASRLGKRPLTVIMIPTPRDRLLPALSDGLGDIAAGNLTVTDDRLKQADFVVATALKPIRELVLTGPKSPALSVLDDLSGKTVHVRRHSSYFESLNGLNARFRQAGKPPMQLVTLPEALEDEDAMEMLNVGLLQILVVDDWKARMWAQILPQLKVHEGIAVREGGKVGWAIRKQSPQLQAAVENFYDNFIRKQSIAEIRLKQYMASIKQIHNNAESDELKRFKLTVSIFETYGKQYNFDPLMLAAQGFQESQLRQDAKSRVGAIGIMQLMPATGKELGVGDIKVTPSNIHAGAKYLDQLMTRYFQDAKFSEMNRPLFAFASYNAGPGKIAKMRTLAAERGLNPDVWFNNVEVVVAENVGIETTTYVRNIYKYYASYRLLKDAEEQRTRAVQQMGR